MATEGWICIARKITEWEWYSDPNVFRLFMHLLLKANFQDNRWQGTLVSRGQFVTSRDKLSAQIGLSVKQIRVAEAKLLACGTITTKGASRFTTYTIVKYDEYQVQTDEWANRRQPKGKLRATKGQQLNKDNNDDNEDNVSIPLALPEWLPVAEWDSFKEMRRRAKAKMTEDAERIALSTLESLRGDGHDPKAVLEQSIMRSWKGLFPIKPTTQPKGQPHGKHTRFEQQDYYAGTEGFDVT